MKTIKILSSLILAGFILTSCNVNDTNYETDYTPPTPPSGVVVVNGNNQVDLYWNENRESDVAGYNIYFNFTYDGKYTLIGSSPYANFVDYEAVNGETYYYAVTAYDYNGNESELSPDVVYSTPRPEGFNQALLNFRQYPDNSGYTFTDYSVVPFDDQSTDFFFGIYNGIDSIMVWGDTDIQDMGPTQDIYDIQYAPTYGWNPSKSEVVIPGHTYVIWTWDNHFAKVRISSTSSNRMVFDWAFQLVEGNVQLKRSVNNQNRNSLSR